LSSDKINIPAEAIEQFGDDTLPNQLKVWEMIQEGTLHPEDSEDDLASGTTIEEINQLVNLYSLIPSDNGLVPIALARFPVLYNYNWLSQNSKATKLMEQWGYLHDEIAGIYLIIRNMKMVLISTAWLNFIALTLAGGESYTLAESNDVSIKWNEEGGNKTGRVLDWLKENVLSLGDCVLFNQFRSRFWNSGYYCVVVMPEGEADLLYAAGIESRAIANWQYCR